VKGAGAWEGKGKGARGAEEDGSGGK